MVIKGLIDMARPTRVHINAAGLLHNVQCVKNYAPGKKIIAMVKANAYGCGLASVIPLLDGQVDAYGVACVEEAITLRALGSRTDCILFQGLFSADELQVAVSHRLQCVIHEAQQLRWILETPLQNAKIKVWVKVNTGMHRLGFSPEEVGDVMSALNDCPWVDQDIGLMTHLACADEPQHVSNDQQLQCFNHLSLPDFKITRSIANSAAIMTLAKTHADVVRPGLMLYGISPFANQTGAELGLVPVMHLVSAVSAIHRCPPKSRVGYGGTWYSEKPAKIGVVAIGYGDGYPRHISALTPTCINGAIVPIVGRVSMDMLTVDLTNSPGVKIGDEVELWGKYIPVETVAKHAGTIAYELISQISSRVRGNT